jgi:hypothetical protein
VFKKPEPLLSFDIRLLISECLPQSYRPLTVTLFLIFFERLCALAQLI